MVSTHLLMLFMDRQFWIVLLIFARILGAITIHPLFASGYFSLLLRTCIALILAFLLVPVASGYEIGADVFGKLALLIANFVYGYIFGYFLGLPIWLIESCGQIIDIQRGEQMGAIVNQLTRNPDSSISRLLTQGFIVYFVLNNGIVFIFDMLFASFKFVPVNNIFPVFDSKHIDEYINLFKEYFYWVGILTIPIVFVLLLVDIVFGVIGSFVPQLNVTMISMPIKSMAALLILSVYLGGLFHNVFAKFIIQLPKIY